MKSKILQSLSVSIAASLCVCSLAVAQERSSVRPGVATLRERIIPIPAGLSAEMLKVVKERKIPPIIPAPMTTTE